MNPASRHYLSSCNGISVVSFMCSCTNLFRHSVFSPLGLTPRAHTAAISSEHMRFLFVVFSFVRLFVSMQYIKLAPVSF